MLRGKPGKLYERQASRRTRASSVKKTGQVPLTHGKLVVNCRKTTIRF